MTLALLFWVLMVVWLVFGLWSNWPPTKTWGGTLLFWILLAILGWAVFGPAIHR
jgi:hypothetical protein